MWKVRCNDSNKKKVSARNDLDLLELLASEALDPQTLQATANALVTLQNLIIKPYC